MRKNDNIKEKITITRKKERNRRRITGHYEVNYQDKWVKTIKALKIQDSRFLL
jgi:hypothetical protein